MKAPTSTYGCGADSCVACYGDQEWREMNEREQARKRLEELRAVIREESLSYGELAELQDLAEYIEDHDVELLEWAGIPEFPEEDPVTVERITFHLSNGAEVQANFSEYGWQQWGCAVDDAGTTMPIVEALEQAAREDDELAVLLGIRETEREV